MIAAAPDGFEYARSRRGRLYLRRKAVRALGHKLAITWSGEYGVESSSTGTCLCGWTESGSSRDVVRFEYRQHLRRVPERTS